MVNSGGKSTMLGHWRIVLKQAEEAAKAGRYDEALALVSRPDVVDHHHAVQLRGRLSHDLVARASRRGAADDIAGAIEDLQVAERLGTPPDHTRRGSRLSLADQVAGEISCADLDAGEPARVVERVDALAKQKVSGPALRRAREAAEAWQAALNEARRGEFGRAQDQLDRAERLAAGIAQAALAASRRELEVRQKAATPKVEALYSALASGKWSETLTAAEAVLETVPEHPAARQARANAWQQIAAIAPSTNRPGTGARAPSRPPPCPNRRRNPPRPRGLSGSIRPQGPYPCPRPRLRRHQSPPLDRSSAPGSRGRRAGSCSGWTPSAVTLCA